MIPRTARLILRGTKKSIGSGENRRFRKARARSALAREPSVQRAGSFIDRAGSFPHRAATLDQSAEAIAATRVIAACKAGERCQDRDFALLPTLASVARVL